MAIGMNNDDPALRLLQNLHQLLTEQALAITARQLSEVVRLSVECARICPQLSPLLPLHDNADAEQLLRACRRLQQDNNAALSRLNNYCSQFIGLLRGAPFAYASHAKVTYPDRRRLICKL